MKKIPAFLFIICLTILYCKSLPVLKPDNQNNAEHNTPFLKKAYRLSHSIRVTLPNNESMVAIGVTVADPEKRSIDAVLMTVEGLVLFDISYREKKVIINRSLPDFENNNFAELLFDDIMLFYFVPGSREHESGQNNDGFVNRYFCENNTVIDQIAFNNGSFEIKKYDSGNDQIRTVNIQSLNKEGIPEKAELIAYGFFGYSLNMELIDFEEIQTTHR
ncbi:MAG: hypothetical protein JW864_10850 [Spirochaetes bacterium]|nr:hypothetical protein [Spirochaetota bacterium]